MAGGLENGSRRHLVLVVSRGGGAKGGPPDSGLFDRGRAKPNPRKPEPATPDPAQRRSSHLRVVAADGVLLPSAIPGGCNTATAPRPTVRAPGTTRVPPPPRSLSRPLGQRVVQVANDVAVLALALLAGLRPRA